MHFFYFYSCHNLIISNNQIFILIFISLFPLFSLTAHLYGPSDNPHYKRMRKQTNCNMYVQNHDDSDNPMTIRISLLHQAPNPNKAFHHALKMIEEILLDFQLPNCPKIGQDGSAGRLLYEIGNCCAGGHRPGNSTSGALTQQRNPFDKTGTKKCCISLVELPSDGDQFHVSFLQKGWLYKKIKETGCSIKLCGFQHDCPVSYGKPYVLIIGGTTDVKKVDHACEMVKRVIQNHQVSCTCAL